MSSRANRQSAAAEPNRITLARGVSVHESDLQYSFSRSSGPGGQNVNKVNTRAELRVRIDRIEGLDEAARARLRDLAGSRLTREDELLIACDESRSQVSNRRGALNRLIDLVSEAAKSPKVRKRRKPGRAAIERRLQRKREKSQKKQRRRWKPEP